MCTFDVEVPADATHDGMLATGELARDEVVAAIKNQEFPSNMKLAEGTTPIGQVWRVVATLEYD